MRSPPLNSDERSRLKHLAALNLLEPDPDAHLEPILRCLAAALGLPWAAVVLADRLTLRCAADIDWTLPDDEGALAAFQRCLEARTPLFIDDPRAADAGTLAAALVPASSGRHLLACIPLQAGGQGIGLLCLAAAAPRVFSPAERALLLDFRSLIVRELELRLDATRDHLTGLLNRRFAEHYIDRETRRAFREQVPIAFVLLDLDHFKNFNDRYGHAAGDEALRQAAFAIHSCCRRPADLAVRLGGEEFLVVLPSTDLTGTRRLLERLTDAVAGLEIPHEGSEAQRLTFSAGAVVATERDPWVPLPQIIKAADALLYQSKDAGRNRFQLGLLMDQYDDPG